MSLDKSLAAIVIGVGLVGINRSGAGREVVYDLASRVGTYAPIEAANLLYDPVIADVGFAAVLGGLVGLGVYGVRRLKED